MELISGVFTVALSIIVALFNTLFFWLPNDPFLTFIQSNQITNSTGFQTGISWLNWLFPMGYLSTLLLSCISVVAVWLVIKLVKHSIKAIHDAVNIFLP